MGYNYRLTNVAAAIGLAQLEELDALLAKRHAMAARYDAALAGIESIGPPSTRPGRARATGSTPRSSRRPTLSAATPSWTACPRRASTPGRCGPRCTRRACSPTPRESAGPWPTRSSPGPSACPRRQASRRILDRVIASLAVALAG
ncbi:MAG: DegT/DnrJ/EryC1/StrS family aminotransferase [Chloroflexota bacterium]